MAGVQTKIDLDLSNLEYVRGSALNKAVRISLNKAAVPVKSAVVGTAPTKTGYLRSAIRIKTQFKNGIWAAVVGPSSSIKKLRKKQKKKPPEKKPKAAKVPSTSGPKPRRKRARTRFGRLVNRARKAGAKKLKRAKKVAAKKAKTLRKRIVRSSLVKNLKNRFKKKLGANDYIRPSRYGSILQFGSKKLAARHYLERAYSSSAGQFTDILTTKLREQLAQMLARKSGAKA